IEFSNRTDPAERGPTEADIIIVWRGAPLGFDHPELGRIGPAPYRRTGGHTGKQGFAFVDAAGMAPGDYGMRSAYDVIPTLFHLLGETPAGILSGKPLLPVQPVTGARPACFR
ncbi:MAG: hypothetical protein OEV14_09445, partial [Gammaproteobacteria bacterium]|nr:hypothetical protein [Gammaproteobacteria bacterium]